MMDAAYAARVQRVRPARGGLVQRVQRVVVGAHVEMVNGEL